MPEYDFRGTIAKKRDGGANSRDELFRLSLGAADGSIPDYQLSAWLMAAYLNPLSIDETVWLTEAIAESGERLNLSALTGPKVDKHSTGGVGDKTTLVLLPILAACGISIVKMSGPGLGITGGTTDKLSSIPGFRIDLAPAEMLEIASKVGIAVGGQTTKLAPADKVIYGLRDATATVDSIPLIVSSVLGKKIAGGAPIIVLDVKCGRGAFMQHVDQARTLARWLESVGSRVGLKVRTTISDMNQPLGSAVGNSLEVREAIRVLTMPEKELTLPLKRFRELLITLAGETLLAAGIAESVAAGAAKASEALDSGDAAGKASRWIAAQGGPASLEEVLAQMDIAPCKASVTASKTGWVSDVDPEVIGQTVLGLGGGRTRKGDLIDVGVGCEVNVTVGTPVQKGEVLVTTFARTQDLANQAIARLLQAVQISDQPVLPSPLFL